MQWYSLQFDKGSFRALRRPQGFLCRQPELTRIRNHETQDQSHFHYRTLADNDEDIMRGLARELTKGGRFVAASIDYRWSAKSDGGASHAFFDWKPDANTKATFAKYGVYYASEMKAFFNSVLY